MTPPIRHKVVLRPEYPLAMRQALADGTYEWEERQIIREIVNSDDRVLELGTCIGVTAMELSAIVGPASVRSVEGNPNVIRFARENFRLNCLPDGLVEHCVLMPHAADFAVEFSVTSSNPVAGSIRRHPWHDAKTLATGVRFSEAVAGFHPTVLVCDIEGGEFDLLPHVDLSSFRAVIVEMHWKGGPEDPRAQAVKAALERQGLMLAPDHSINCRWCFLRTCPPLVSVVH